MIRGGLTLLGVLYIAALSISSGLQAAAAEDFLYPDRAAREASRNKKLLNTPVGSMEKIVIARQALHELENRNLRRAR